ncbi:MAG: ABC transporter substrate-binding protein [Janthinobacterium lividum]
MAATLACTVLGATGSALAQVKIGVSLSTTGPGASLGIPEKNTIALLPREIGGKSVQYIVLDDASDASKAVQNTRKLISEDHVDAVIGSTITPTSLAMIDVVAEASTPLISLAASTVIIAPPGGKHIWSFKTPQNDSLMADALAEHMQKRGLTKVAFIGFADAYGDSWIKEFGTAAKAHGLTITVDERFNRTDTSVTGQVLRAMASNPQAVLIAGAGTPAALPEKTLKERGYAGAIYQTHGVANNDFLRVCGKDCNGTFLPAGPLLVADQLPASNPVKASAMTYKSAYEKANGVGSLSTFGGHAWDAGQMLSRAIPVALTKAQPGTQAFREALRAALENIKDAPVSQGIMNTTPDDHNGFDRRARVMVEIVDEKWKLQPD